MNKLKFLILLVGLLAFNSVGASAGQITRTVTFDPSKLTISYDTIDNVAYAKIHYKDMSSVNGNGHPVLPSDVLLFSVPYNADSFDVHCNVISYYDYQLNADVYPSPQINGTNDSIVVVYNQKDSTIYGMNSFYPDSLFRAIGTGFMNGGNRILKTHLYPVFYNPTTRKLRLATSMQLVVNYDTNTSIIPSVVRRNNEILEKEQSLTESFVQNGEDVAINAYEAVEPLSAPSIVDNRIPSFNYCIITSRELEPAFKKIIAMKRQKGLSAGTVCIEDLMASPAYNSGDLNNNYCFNSPYILNDSAGIVRNYLKHSFNKSINPTSYVLMGGRKEHAPVRYFGFSRSIATDNYFSDLTQIWDDMGNIWMGEGTQVDLPICYSPDLYVGRLLCSTKSEIDNYSNKLYKYVFNPGDGDKSYLKRALYFCNFVFEDDCEYTSSSSSDFFDNTNLVKVNQTLSGVDLINEINTTKYGYISGYVDGEPQAMLIRLGYMLTALDEYVPENNDYVDEAGNGLDNLSNNFFPAIYYSLTSSAITFDNSDDLNDMTQFANKYNLGESFTVGGKYGGIAYLGNTKKGYREWTSPLECCFFRSMRTNHGFKLGVSEGMSKVLNVPFHEYWYDGPYNEVISSHNLIGDPEVEMWTSIPQNYTGLSVTRQSVLSVEGVTPSDTIGYCDNEGNVGRIYGNNGTAILTGVSHNSSIMVYNHDHIPYIFPLILQNCDINNSQYVYASSFSAGRSVSPSYTNGNVTIKHGAVYEVEATDNVYLGEGFFVENRATFSIKTPGKVIMDGCVFQSGSKVNIEAGNIEFVGKFTAEFGSKVEFKHYVD